MKNFARQWVDPTFQFTSLLFLVVLHISLLVGVILGLIFQSLTVGLSAGASVIFIVYLTLILIWYANRR